MLRHRWILNQPRLQQANRFFGTVRNRMKPVELLPEFTMAGAWRITSSGLLPH